MRNDSARAQAREYIDEAQRLFFIHGAQLLKVEREKKIWVFTQKYGLIAVPVLLNAAWRPMMRPISIPLYVLTGLIALAYGLSYWRLGKAEEKGLRVLIWGPILSKLFKQEFVFSLANDGLEKNANSLEIFEKKVNTMEIISTMTLGGEEEDGANAIHMTTYEIYKKTWGRAKVKEQAGTYVYHLLSQGVEEFGMAIRTKAAGFDRTKWRGLGPESELLTGNPTFDDVFRIITNDAEFGHRYLTPQVKQALMAYHNQGVKLFVAILETDLYVVYDQPADTILTEGVVESRLNNEPFYRIAEHFSFYIPLRDAIEAVVLEDEEEEAQS